MRAKTAYLDCELCGVGDDGLPNFAETQAATDGARGVRPVFYAFDLLHLDGRDTAAQPLVERGCCLSRLWPAFPACSSMVTRLVTASLSAAMPASLVSRASYRRRPPRPTLRELALPPEW